ncbi:MAG TPA: hypothetical protein EYP85_08685 [Armatimonadetes bacterium]|nr:hypothetical protein [Armatimonadota bacterium]
MRKSLTLTIGLVLLGILLALLVGCGGGGTALPSSGPSSGPGGEVPGPLSEGYGTIVGQVQLVGQTDHSGVTITAERVWMGQTVTVQRLLRVLDEEPTRLREVVEEVQEGGAQTRANWEGFYTAVTDVTGHFVIPNVLAGEYTLTAQKGDFVALKRGVQVEAGQTATVNFGLTRQNSTGTIKGEVRLSGQPHNSGILVFVEDTSYLAYSEGAFGVYTIPNVPVSAAPYTIHAAAAGYADGLMELPSPLTAGATLQAPLIVLNPGVTVIGHVVREYFRDPVADATVWSINGVQTTTDTDGIFALRRVPPGDVVVLVDKSGFEQGVGMGYAQLPGGAALVSSVYELPEDIYLPIPDPVRVIDATNNNLSGEVLWKEDKLITEDVTVSAGALLVIYPGVMVRFASGKKMVVNGALRVAEWEKIPAEGPPEVRTRYDGDYDQEGPYVRFTSDKPVPSPGDWGGLVFKDQSADDARKTELHHARVEFAGPGITCDNSSPPIRYCEIVDNAPPTGTNGGGILCLNNAAPHLENNYIAHNRVSSDGGGIYCDNSSPWITHNNIEGNSADGKGGGIACANGAAPRIADNYVSGNWASASGGGIYTASGTSPLIRDNQVEHNRADYGGGLSVFGATAVKGNRIEENRADHRGGGIECKTDTLLEANTLLKNRADFGGGLYIGGLAVAASPTVRYNLIAQNRAGPLGGGILVVSPSSGSGSAPSLYYNTLANNEAGVGGGVCITSNSTPTLKDSIIAFNNASNEAGGVFVEATATATLDYNDIYGNLAPTNPNYSPSDLDLGPRAMEEDPLFVNPPYDYALQPDSPCIGAAEDPVHDMGAIQFGHGKPGPP